MSTLIDTSLWIDFTRARSPAELKRSIAPHILHADAHVAEPIVFEILRHATAEERLLLERQFQTYPFLATPADLWTKAATLGQRCRQHGITVGSLDLLIASLAIHHDAELISFDDDFQKIAGVSDLRIRLLVRPGD